MTNPGTPAALATALAYDQAWTSQDLDRSMTCIADDITCDAPGARISGAQRDRDFLAGFMAQLTGVKTVAAVGDDTTAVLFYCPHTAQLHRRQYQRWGFETAPGCGPVATVEYPGIAGPMLVARFPDGSYPPSSAGLQPIGTRRPYPSCCPGWTLVFHGARRESCPVWAVRLLPVSAGGGHRCEHPVSLPGWLPPGEDSRR